MFAVRDEHTLSERSSELVLGVPGRKLLRCPVRETEKSRCEGEDRIAAVERVARETIGVLEPALLIFNPTSGRDHADNAARLTEIVQSLRAHGIDARIGLKTSGKVARSLARDAVRSGHPLVVVAAGDGTIAAPNNAASPTALAQTTMPVIQRERLALGLLVITVPVLL
jgi:hypothetical protein